MSSAHAHLSESAVAKMLRSHLGLQVHPAKSEELAPSLSSVAPGLGSNSEKYIQVELHRHHATTTFYSVSHC
jgi:hypothetical protein